MLVEQPLASVTVTVNGKQPTVVGVPEIVRVVCVVEGARPGGSVPARTKVYGAVPPLAVITSLYGTPGQPPGSVAGVSVTPVTGGVYVTLPVQPESESVNVTVKS